MAEFERLYKMWVRTKNKIQHEIFPLDKEKEFQKYKKQVMNTYKRDLALVEDFDRKRAARTVARSVHSKGSQSISPTGKTDRDNKVGSTLTIKELDVRILSQAIDN